MDDIQDNSFFYDYIKEKGTKDFNYRLSIEIDNNLTPETWKNKEI